TSHGTRPSPTPGRTSSIGSRTARRGSPRRLEPSLDGSPPATASGPGGDRQPLLALMDGEVPQSCLGVSGEATPRTARQPHDLPRDEVDRAGLGLESPGSGEDMDEDIEVRAGVLTDLSARCERDDIGVEVSLLRWQLPDGPRGFDVSGEVGDVEDDSRCRGRSLFADAHAHLVRRALKRLPAHCVGELPDHLHPQALGHVIVDQDQSVADLQRLIGLDDARVALGLRNGADVDDGFFCQGGSFELFQWILVYTITMDTQKRPHTGRGDRRAEILRALRAETTATAAELAEALGIHPNTVRFHLGVLESNGDVIREQVPARRPGRPELRFRIVARPSAAGPDLLAR